MKRSFIVATVLIAVASSGWVRAAPVTLDFDTLGVAPSTAPITFGNIYDEDGFRLQTNAVFGGFGSYNNPSSVFYTGSTALFANQNGGLTTLTQLNGDPFSMTGINLAFRGPTIVGQSTSLVFTGIKSGGSTVVQTFNYDQATVAPISSENFLFSANFTDLISVSWLQGNEGHQFDNIVVDGSPSSGVPEPAGLAVFGLGLVLLGLMLRRQRQSRGY